MRQVQNPKRVAKSVLLAGLMLGSVAYAVVPPAEAQVGCVARVDDVRMSPALWVDPGASASVRFFVNNIALGQQAVGLKIKLVYKVSDANNQAIPGASGSQTLTPPTNYTTPEFTIPAGQKGKAVISYSLASALPDPSCVVAADNQDPGVDMTYWIDQRPDLVVTKVQLVKHTAGQPPGVPEVHEPLSADANFTRYPAPPASPSTTPCLEQRQPNFPSLTHLSLTVRNAGDADLKVIRTFKGPGGNTTEDVVNVDAQSFDNAQFLNTSALPARIAAGQEQVFDLPDVYSLVGKFGLRNITIRVDPANRVPELNETNNVFSTPDDRDAQGAWRGIYIRAPDLTGSINASVSASKKLTGKFSVVNGNASIVGDLRVAGDPYLPNQPDGSICNSENGRKVVSRAYLDKEDEEHLLTPPLEATLVPGEAPTVSEDFRDLGELGAGPHRVILVVDWSPDGTGNVTELSELNNRILHLIEIEDKVAPVLSQVGVQPPADLRRAGGKINISGNVTDDADFTLAGNDVFIDMDFPDGTNVSFAVPHGNDTAAGYVANNPNNKKDVRFWFNSTYSQVGSYTFRVRAVDLNHTVRFPPIDLPPLGFTLTEFPKTMELFSLEVCNEGSKVPNVTLPSDCAQYNQTSGQPANKLFNGGENVVRIRFKVPANATGLQDESRNTTRKTVHITDPDGVVLGNYTVNARCWDNLQQAPGSDVQCANPNSIPDSCAQGPPPLNQTPPVCWNHLFEVVVGGNAQVNATQLVLPNCAPVNQLTNTRYLKPAQYNVTFFVGDNLCKFRGHDPPSQQNPLRFRFGLWDTVPASLANVTLVSPSPVPAGNSLALRGEATDNIKVKQVVSRISRGGELVKQYNMTPVSVNATSGNGTYSIVVPTGIYTDLDREGDYQWLFGVLDANHTLSWWNNANGTTCTPQFESCTPLARTFRVADNGRPPVVSNARTALPDGTAATDFQLGDSLLVQADIDDDTRLVVREAVVESDAGGELFRLNLTRVAGTLYRSEEVATGTGARLGEGLFRFVVRATDSAGHLTETPFTAFRVVTNLPPTFTQRTPDRFGVPNGTVGVDITDNLHGVLASTVAARYGVNTPGEAATAATGLVVVERENRADGTVLSVRATFPLPATARHGDEVTVNVTASDGTDLVGSVQWAFRLDGLAPRSTLTCTRSYPLACGSEGPQAVRGDTVFNLTAVDPNPDGRAASGLAEVRYAVDVAGTPGELQVVRGNTTFRLGQFADRDGFYTLRFRAVDAAGNEEPERRLVFALDTQGPSVQNPLVTPTSTGWNVTATISDLASQVRSATIFVRGSATGFEARPMDRLPETQFWYGTIPGARRGAQVCYYMEAVDNLDNVAGSGSAASPVCFQSENHPPQLTVTSPSEGEAVGAALTVRWQVSDIDGDPVTVAVSYRRAGEVQLVAVPLSPEEQGSRSKVIDAGSLVPGGYLLRVDATDNQAFNNRTTRLLNITVGGDEPGTLGRPQLDRTTIAPGEQITVRVEIARAVSSVEARLLRGTETVAREVMEQNPAGSRFWEATFRISEPGVYEVEVSGEYEDGTPFVIKAAGSVTVRGGLLGLGDLDTVLIVGLAAAVVAVGVVGLRRRGGL